MPSENIEVEPIGEEQDNPIELQEYLITLLNKRFPINQQLGLLNHEIEKTKLQIKISYAKYFKSKEINT